MDKHSVKSKLQNQLANLVNNTWKKGQNGVTLELATGSGKTRTACILIKHIVDNYGVKEVLIVTPTQTIRDVVWTNEIKKWIGERYLLNVRLECIHTVWKWKNREFGLVICDEVHNYLPIDKNFLADQSEFVKFFKNNKILRLLGLSAWIPKNKRKALNTYAPIIYSLPIDKSVKMGLVSNYHIYIIEVPFTDREEKVYLEYDDKFTHYEDKLGGRLVAYSNARTILDSCKGKDIKSLSTKAKVLFQRAVQYQKYLSARQHLLYNNSNKFKIVDKAFDLYDKPAICFSESKDFANELRLLRKDKQDTLPVHSGIPKGRRSKYLAEFSKNEQVTKLSAVKAINEGLHIPSVKFSILAAGNGTEKDFLQRLGRNLSVNDEEDIATMLCLYTPNTQEATWTWNRMKSIDKNKITKIKDLNEIPCLRKN